MKLFVYSMREYDELAFFEKFCGEYGVEFGYTTQTPCLENVELAKGYDVVEHESGLYYFNRMGEPLGNPKLAILRSYSNVVVTPHTAFYTDEAVSNMAENSIIGAMKFISGEHSSFEVR